MLNKTIHTPTKQEENEMLILLSTGDPYEILQLDFDCSNTEITKKYKELSRKYLGDKEIHDGAQNMKIRLENAYLLLSNKRLKEIYDKFLYDTFGIDTSIINNNRYGNLLFHPDSNYMKLKIFGTISSFAPLLVLKVQAILNSSKSITKTTDIIKRIYKEGGLLGFLNGFTGASFSLSLGYIDVLFDTFFYSVVNPDKLPSSVCYLSNSFIIPLVKNPMYFTFDLLDLAPSSYTIYEVIKKVLLRVDGDGPIQWKYLFFGTTTTMFSYLGKLWISQLIYNITDHCYKKNQENPKSLFWKYSNIIMDNVFIRSSIITLFNLPFDIIRSQNTRIFMDSYLNNKSVVPIAMNPVSIAIDLYKSSGIKRFFNGYLLAYFVVVCQEINNECNDALILKEQNQINSDALLE